MRNNIAIIDLGSNLTKLVVVAGTLPLQVIHRSVYDTKTLKSAPKGFFDIESIARIEHDIAQVLDMAQSFNCSTILGIATSAFRTRSNGKEVISDINKKFGIHIQIIAGKCEAQLIFKGALASVTPEKFPVLVMDIGGGSTEFIIGNRDAILWKHSFNFGSTSLTKGLDLNDPITTQQIAKLSARLHQYLSALFEAINLFQPVSFIGTTGAFETFAQLIEVAKGNEMPVNSGYIYPLPDLRKVLKKIMQSSSTERAQMNGMNQLRVPTIHVAAVILNHVLEQTSFSHYYLSLGDVKEGLALEVLSTSTNVIMFSKTVK